MIEIEKLAIIDEGKYQGLGEVILGVGGEDLGENNTESVFFISDVARIKVQKNSSKGSAKIAWKSGAAVGGVSKRQEIEVGILAEGFSDAVDLVEAMVGDCKKIWSDQKRHDYVVDGVNVSVKHSEDFGYHVEFDKNITDESESEAVLAEIESVAKKLGVAVMSDEEEKAFIENVVKNR